jgi:hypothetical protein
VKTSNKISPEIHTSTNAEISPNPEGKVEP